MNRRKADMGMSRRIGAIFLGTLTLLVLAPLSYPAGKVRDAYVTLGIANPSTATADDIKKAYRKLSLKWHPDLNPGDKAAEDNFKKLSTEYWKIQTPERRALYDRYGDAAFDGTMQFPSDGAGGELIRGQGSPVDLDALKETIRANIDPRHPEFTENLYRNADTAAGCVKAGFGMMSSWAAGLKSRIPKAR